MNPEDRFPAVPTAAEPENTLNAFAEMPAVSRYPTPPEPTETRFLKWTFFGSQGLRAGWSVALFLVLTFIFMSIFQVAASILLPKITNIKTNQISPVTALIGKALQFLAILGAVAACSLVERRRIVGYNLVGPTRLRHFVVGSVAGFIALSLLVGSLFAGGWLRFDPVALSGVQFFFSPASPRKAACAAISSSRWREASISGGPWG